MKEPNKNNEYTKSDVTRFLITSHAAIISNIIVLGFTTYINGPILISILFGVHALYRIWVLTIFQSTKRKALESGLDIVEYMNRNRSERLY